MTRRSAPQLIDVNVLFALLWPAHLHHSAAQTWFASEGHTGWATNAITQSGVLRLLTNPAATKSAVNAVAAVRVLSEAMRHPGHHFWPMDLPVPDALRSAVSGITGHRQWTDLILIREAARRSGRLVTFDSALLKLSGAESAAVHLLKD